MQRPAFKAVLVQELLYLATAWRYWVAVLFVGYIAFAFAENNAASFTPFGPIAGVFLALAFFAVPVTGSVSASAAYAPYMASRPAGRATVLAGRSAAYALMSLAVAAVWLGAFATFPGAFETQRTSFKYTDIARAEQVDGSLRFESDESRACYERWDTHAKSAPSACMDEHMIVPKEIEQDHHLVLITTEQRGCISRWKEKAVVQPEKCKWHVDSAGTRLDFADGRHAIKMKLSEETRACIRTLNEYEQSPLCEAFARVVLETPGATFWGSSSDLNQQMCLDWWAPRTRELQQCAATSLQASVETSPPAFVYGLLLAGCLLFWSILSLAWQPRSKLRWILGVTAVSFVAGGGVSAFVLLSQMPFSPWWKVVWTFSFCALAYYLARRSWVTGELEVEAGFGRSYSWRRSGWSTGIAIVSGVIVLLWLSVAMFFMRTDKMGSSLGADATSGRPTVTRRLNAGERPIPPSAIGAMPPMWTDPLEGELYLHKHELQACQDHVQVPLGYVGGRVFFEIEVGPRGKVTEVRKIQNNTAEWRTLRCMKRVLRDFQFDSSMAGKSYEVKIDYGAQRWDNDVMVGPIQYRPNVK